MPTTSATSTIIAQAFRIMEMAPISSFGDDTPMARDAAEQYPVARRMCLSSNDWSFASTIADLPERADITPVDHDLPFSFTIPSDCVRLIGPVDKPVSWRRDRDAIRADAPGPLRVRYTSDVEIEDQLPATFQTAVAYQLAVLLAPRWVGAQARIAGIEDKAVIALRAAMKEDARSASLERYDGRTDHVADWVEFARR